jgi:hypothetical protein
VVKWPLNFGRSIDNYTPVKETVKLLLSNLSRKLKPFIESGRVLSRV